MTLVVGVALTTGVSAQQTSVLLYLSPASKSLAPGDILDVDVLINTQGKSINALDAQLNFQPSKLQVISPSIGDSVIQIWTSGPTFDNAKGTVTFQGGIPNPGLNTRSGRIAKVRFRALSAGKANVTFSSGSEAYLNDGLGTSVMVATSGSEYVITAYESEEYQDKLQLEDQGEGGKQPIRVYGPNVSSPTHPDELTWYKERKVEFVIKSGSAISGHSFILDEDPATEPDEVSEGNQGKIVYDNLEDGVHYLHARSLQNDVWGEATHFAVRIDATAPEDFKIDVAPSIRSTIQTPVISYGTKDTLSGLDRYEVSLKPKKVNLSKQDLEGLGAEVINLLESGAKEEKFFERDSPFTPTFKLPVGEYVVKVRAYDVAGNYREVEQEVEVVIALMTLTNRGIMLGPDFIIPWLYMLIILMLTIIAFNHYVVLVLRSTAKNREKLATFFEKKLSRKRKHHWWRKMFKSA